MSQLPKSLARAVVPSLALVALLAGTAAAVPGTMSFTARLTDNGQPVEGNVALEVELYDQAEGGTLLWEETHPVLVAERGLVYARLGSVDPVNNGLDGRVFDGQTVYAQLVVDGDVLLPRIPLTSVPYAVRAGTAAELEGFDPSGVITGVTAGTGLGGGGSAGDVTLSVNTAVIQARVTGTCAAGSFVTAVNANGTVTCATDAVGTGDITGVAAGTGLAGGGTSGDVSLSIAAGGVGTTQLADNAVTTAKIADGTVSTADIANNAVTMAKFIAPAGQAAQVMPNGSFFVYPASITTTEPAGSCMVTASALFLGSTNVAGFRVRPTISNAANASFSGLHWGYSTAVNVGVVSEFPNGTSGREATSTGVLNVSGGSPWRVGCEIQGNQNSITCRVSYLCH